MKFLAILLPLAGLAVAQSGAASTPAESNGSAPAPSRTPTPQETCLKACGPTDVNCQARCVGVPFPGESAMNSATECVAKCDQGDGSQAATDRYALCRNNCLSSFITLGTTAVAATGTGAGASPTGTGASGSGNGTNGSAASTSSEAAAPTGFNVVGAGSTLGLVLAAFAML